MNKRLTFPTLQLAAGSIRDVVGGVAVEAAGGAAAEQTVSGARLTADL